VIRPVLLVTLLAACLTAACLLSGCSHPPAPHFDGRTFQRGRERFHVAALGAPWRRIEAPDGDLAWEHTGTHAVIAANATCRGHKDSPLSVLMNDLLMGTTARRFLLEETVVLDGREALHYVVAARLDGVPVVFDLYVVKKDGCVYDLTLVTRPRAYEGAAGTFVDFVTAFRGLGKGRG